MTKNIPAVPQRRLMKLLKIIRTLHKKPRRINSLARGFKVSGRTMYRYINILEHMSLVEIKGDKWNRKVSMVVKKCPCCGGTCI